MTHLRLHGTARTQESSRILQRLCYHFSRKIEVRGDAGERVAQFAWGSCTMHADGEVLSFLCEAADAEGLARVRHVIDEHMALFSRKQPLAVQWLAEAAAPG